MRFVFEELICIDFYNLISIDDVIYIFFDETCSPNFESILLGWTEFQNLNFV